MSETFMTFVLPKTEMVELVQDMRRQGYNVESTPLGYVCHEQTRLGLILVLSALKGTERFRVKANMAFFETGNGSRATH